MTKHVHIQFVVQIVQKSLQDYSEQLIALIVLFLFSTFVCPTEIIAFSDRIQDFHAINTEVVGVSTDSHFSHLAWINTPRKVSSNDNPFKHS